MKRIARLVALPATLVALTLASGCAAGRLGTSSATPRAEASSEYYIQAVNQSAWRRGYQVEWINPPRDR